MKNAVIAALVSALVAVGFAGAAVTPVQKDQRIQRLSKRVAHLESDISCFQGAIVQVETQTGTDGNVYYVQPDTDTDANAVYVATVDASCVG